MVQKKKEKEKETSPSSSAPCLHCSSMHETKIYLFQNSSNSSMQYF
jgi:hypothetical protein